MADSPRQEARPSPSELPPELPDAARGLSFYPFQLVGMLLIMLLPLLALLGVFGPGAATSRAISGALALEVSYPSLMRYKEHAHLKVTVRNGGEAPQEVTVEVEAAYLERFAEIAFTPAALTVGDTHYRVALGEVGPGERATLLVTLSARHYGRHGGAVRAFAGDSHSETRLSTLVFP